jgi:hypothetical protein
MRRLKLIAAGIVLLGGCATITKGTTQLVGVNTPGVPGARCTLKSPAIGTRVVTTPAQIELDKSLESVSVVCSKECYQDGVGTIASNTEAMTAGNVVLGGVVGLGIDAASGALNKYSTDNQIAMMPIPGCKARS